MKINYSCLGSLQTNNFFPEVTTQLYFPSQTHQPFTRSN
uniref:Uncharacterized protein n=1 Tax=Arundo donax TaxID=35708 RepID=A0A0A9HMP6_ARUDO